MWTLLICTRSAFWLFSLIHFHTGLEEGTVNPGVVRGQLLVLSEGEPYPFLQKSLPVLGWSVLSIQLIFSQNNLLQVFSTSRNHVNDMSTKANIMSLVTCGWESLCLFQYVICAFKTPSEKVNWWQIFRWNKLLLGYAPEQTVPG